MVSFAGEGFHLSKKMESIIKQKIQPY